MLPGRFPPLEELVDHFREHGPAGASDPFWRELRLSALSVVDMLVVFVRMAEFGIAAVGVVVSKDASGDGALLPV